MRSLIVFAALLLVPPVANAGLHGGIEIGSRGVKVVVLEFTPLPDGYELVVKFTETVNTTLVAGIAAKGEFDGKAIDQTADVVAKYAARFRTEFQVPEANLYVVGSSGLFSPIETQTELVAANKKRLADAVNKASRLTMNFITATQEAELSVEGIVPFGQRDNAVLIDIGGGNTKGGFAGAKQAPKLFAIPFGTISFTEFVKKKGGDFNREIVAARPMLEAKLHEFLVANPEARKRPRVYISGGTPWAVATIAAPGDRRAFTPVTMADIDAIEQKLLADPSKIPTPNFAAIPNEMTRTAAVKEFDKVQKAYEQADVLLGGVEVLKAVAKEFQFADPTKTVLFARHGSVGWLLAYVVRAENVKK